MVIREFFCKLGAQLGLCLDHPPQPGSLALHWRDDLHGDNLILRQYMEWLIKQFQRSSDYQTEAPVTPQFVATVRRLVRVVMYKRVSHFYQQTAAARAEEDLSLARSHRAEATRLEEVYDWWEQVLDDFVRDYELDPEPAA